MGHCGLLDKDIEGEILLEVNYILHPDAWGKGYAAEIGRGVIRHAFEELRLDMLTALIHPENIPSERTAQRLGMSLDREVIWPGSAVRKHYRIQKSI